MAERVGTSFNKLLKCSSLSDRSWPISAYAGTSAKSLQSLVEDAEARYLLRIDLFENFFGEGEGG